MKTVEELNKQQAPMATFDPSLEQYQNKILFPKKLEKAKEMLKDAKLPHNKNKNK